MLTTMSERFEINDPTVVADTIDGMAVIIHLEQGAYYSGEGAAGEAWAAVASGATVAELAAAFGVAESDVSGFVATAVAEGLLRPRSAPAGAWVVSAAFTPLALERFNDLEDLLLLDPVHDVSNEGWPKQPPT